MAGSIHDVSAAPLPTNLLRVDVVVVGSGSGGAVAARGLARAGQQVLVLEEGADFQGKALTQRESQMYDQLYMDRGGRMTRDLSITVLQGRVLGGGGVINAADVVPIPQPVMRHWEKVWGLPSLGPDALGRTERRVLEELSANPVNDTAINLNNRMLKEGAERLGMRGEVLLHNRIGCRGLGNCLIGCPFDAKTNPRKVAVPQAMEAGAEFATRVRALRIEGLDQEWKTVHAVGLDARGHQPRAPLKVQARRVILAANAVGSAQLLLASGVDNPHLGRHLSLQPQLPVVALFKEEIRAFRGIPQSYAMTEFETVTEGEGLGGFRLEGIMGTPGITSTLLPWSGHQGKEMMALYPRLSACLSLVPDRSTGRVELSGTGRPVISFEFTAEYVSRVKQAARAAARIYLARGAERVVIPALRPVEVHSEADLPKIDALDFSPASVPMISAHQQGSARFARTERDGVLSEEGEVFGARGVYVFDSSGFPTSSSTHTMAPIMMLSHYLTDRLIASI